MSAGYTDFDIVAFLLFGLGRIADERPELLQQLHIATAPGIDDATIQSVLDDLRSIDPEFHEQVTLNAMAGDPYRAEAAIGRLNEDVIAFAKRYEEGSGGTFAAARAARGANGSVWAYSNYVVSTQVAATAGAVVSVLAVALALALLVYEQGDDGSDLISQGHAAALSAL